ncbi:MAG: hypothetical protein ACK40X_11540 [Armatimonadota bacterium]
MRKLDTLVAIVFIVVGLPVVGGLAFAAYSEYLKHRREVVALKSSGSGSEVEQLRERVRELEQRVEALEAIVTSPEFQLFQERMRQIQAEAKKSLPSNQQQLTLTPQQENQR